MLNHTHYVPILRWKQGEKIAIREIGTAEKSVIMPLIELLPKDFGGKKNATTISKEVSKFWGDSPFFLDLKYFQDPFGSSISTILEILFATAWAYDLTAIPVTGLNRTPEYQRGITKLGKKDLCLRLSPEDILKETFKHNLDKLISNLSLTPKQIHLLVDFGVYTNSQRTIKDVVDLIPYLNMWKSFIVSCSAFPQDLSKLEKNQQHELPRYDWLNWRAYVLSTLGRKPTYSDYTVQYGNLVKLAAFPRFSASIRYTHEDYWVIMRGESVFKDDGPGFQQWPGIAQLLCEQIEFCGREYSYGDKYIYDMSLQSENSGNAGTWIRAGINHHLVFATRQISNLFASANVS